MWSKLADLKHDDETLYDLSKGMGPDYEPPEYPGGLQFSISEADLAKAGVTDPKPGDSGGFSAMATVTSIFQNSDNSRIEMELEQFAGEDGKLFGLATPAHLCLCGPELEKMGLEADCERGDTIHLIGKARVESCSSTEFSGEMICLQITDLGFEDESSEARG